MESWDLLSITHRIDIDDSTINRHRILIESSDSEEISFLFANTLQLLNNPKSYANEISRDKHMAKISLYDVATDSISEYQDPSNKKDRPFERDLYWKLILLIRSRGWQPFSEWGVFIKYRN